VSVFNRRNAVIGWVTVKVGKWMLRRKAKRSQLLSRFGRGSKKR